MQRTRHSGYDRYPRPIHTDPSTRTSAVSRYGGQPRADFIVGSCANASSEVRYSPYRDQTPASRNPKETIDLVPHKSAEVGKERNLLNWIR